MHRETIQIHLLGGMRVIRGEEVVTRFRTRKAAELLAYLAYHPRRAHPREVLVELLWPECDLQTGRHNLSMALSFLRQQLEPPGVPDGSILQADRHSVGLRPNAVATDVTAFEEAIASAFRSEGEERARHLAAAVGVYGGELLPGFYDDWVGPEQQRLDELFFQALRQLVAHAEAAGALDQALQFALRGVSADRLREEAHREVIRLYLAAGQPDAALRQYRELERVLRQELDSAPGPQTRALLQQAGTEAPAAAPRRASTPDLIPPPAPLRTASALEPIGGAVPLTSRFYVERPTDAEFRAAIERQDSIVLVKGARQVGKTSLLARGLQQARQAGARVVQVHFQALNASHLETPEAFFQALAEMIAAQLELEVSPGEVWSPRLGPNLNFSYFLRRQVLKTLEAPLVWGLDEVDRLFTCPFGSEVFGLFRSWHDERALEPDGPWRNLTLSIAYSTEAHLFITDINQSPFNVGTRLSLEDFTPEQLADLNQRYGAPLRDPEELERFRELLGGHPYLVRRGLHELASRGMSFAAFEARADSDDWIFGEHLRRIVILLARVTELSEAVRELLQGRPGCTYESFYRLRSAGVITGEAPHDAAFRCRLYARYLARRLA